MSAETIDSPTTIVVADDYPLYVEGLRGHLEKDDRFTLVGVGTDGDQAVTICEKEQPRVALLGYFLAGSRGGELLQRVMTASDTTSIVVLAGIVDPDVVHTAVAVGARGYLVKQEPGPAVLEALFRVGRGGTAFSPAAEACLIDAVRARADESDTLPSSRESEILRHLAGGQTSREMAQLLYLSEATIKSHLNRLYRKLGVNERSAAVAEAMRRGWIS